MTLPLADKSPSRYSGLSKKGVLACYLGSRSKKDSLEQIFCPEFVVNDRWWGLMVKKKVSLWLVEVVEVVWLAFRVHSCRPNSSSDEMPANTGL